jgi:hypothetical protein
MSVPDERSAQEHEDRGLSGAGLQWAEAGFPDLD